MTRESNLKSGSVGSVGSAELLVAIRNLYSRHPEYFHHEPWELVHVLYSLNYIDDLVGELVRVKEDVHRLKEKAEEDVDLDLRLALDRVSFARTLGVEQSELISRLDTFATKKGKHD